MGIMDELGLGSLFGGADGLTWAATMESLFSVFFWIFVLAIIAVMGGYLTYASMFKHTYIEREVVKNRKVIRRFRARELREKNGCSYWQLWGTRDKIPIPPPEAIEITHRGKKWVEAYRLETGETIYVTDRFKSEEVPKEILEIPNKNERVQKVRAWHEAYHIIPNFQPLNSAQREMLSNQVVKAYSRKRTEWREYIVPIVALSMALLLVISLMVFWGDIAAPAIDGKQLNLRIVETQKETVEVLQDIKRRVQTIPEASGHG